MPNVCRNLPLYVILSVTTNPITGCHPKTIQNNLTKYYETKHKENFVMISRFQHIPLKVQAFSFIGKLHSVLLSYTAAVPKFYSCLRFLPYFDNTCPITANESLFLLTKISNKTFLIYAAERQWGRQRFRCATKLAKWWLSRGDRTVITTQRATVLENSVKQK